MAPLLLLGAALGGAAMYFFDPDRGARRRALLRDQAVKGTRKVRDVMDAGARDLANRRAGVTGQVRSLFKRRSVDDDVLVERVRSKMGRYVSHPGAIDVAAAGAHVTLSGSVLAHEHEELLEAVREVSGVRDIIDRLAVHKTAEGVSELQGGRPRRGDLPELMQENWSPGIRILTSAAALTFALYGLRQKGINGILALAAGAGLFVRSAANKPFRRLAGLSGHRAIDVQKTIQIAAPVERVFEFFANYENFPRFMRNVLDVEARAGGQSHWTVAGPAGSAVHWDAVTTQLEPNRRIAWSTVPGSAVQHAGIIRLEPFGDGTRVQIDMSYNPPAGALGHVVAKLFGADPKTELDEDLMRLKTTLETGKAPHDAARRDAGAINQ